MTERDKIVQELGNLTKTHFNSGITHKLSYTMKRWELELVAEWIIAEKKRICEPLLTPHTVHKGNELDICIRAIKQTLKNAGLEQEK